MSATGWGSKRPWHAQASVQQPGTSPKEGAGGAEKRKRDGDEDGGKKCRRDLVHPTHIDKSSWTTTLRNCRTLRSLDLARFLVDVARCFLVESAVFGDTDTGPPCVCGGSFSTPPIAGCAAAKEKRLPPGRRGGALLAEWLGRARRPPPTLALPRRPHQTPPLDPPWRDPARIPPRRRRRRGAPRSPPAQCCWHVRPRRRLWRA